MSNIKSPKKYVVEFDPFSQLVDSHPILWEIKFPHVPKMNVAEIKSRVVKMSSADRKVVLKNAKAQAANAQAVIDAIEGIE